MKNINSKLKGRYQSTKRTTIDAKGHEHTWCPALMLEEAAEDTGAVEVLAQLKLARYLTGLTPEELLIDMNTLSNLDTLHERHRHVFNAFSEHSPSSSKLNAAELSAVDD